MATTPAKTTRKTVQISVQRLVADGNKATALVEVAKRQVRTAKADLKRARKLVKAAKKAAKQAKKKLESGKAAALKAPTAAARTRRSTPLKPVNAAVRSGSSRKAVKKTAARAVKTSFKSAADVAKSVIGRLTAAKASAPTSADASPSSPAPDAHPVKP